MSASVDAAIQQAAAGAPATGPATPIVIKEDRSIVVPTAMQQIAVQCDNEANVLHFVCPRNWADIDLAAATLYINVVKPDNSTVAFVCTNVVSSEDTVTFDWVVTEHITEVAGKLSFLVCARDPSDPGNGYRWHSNLCDSLFIAPGIVCTVPGDTLYPPHIPLYGTDTTLTEPGVPADAAVVGDRLNILEESQELSKWSYRNLLDNAYWANADSIIDQRGGYVVPPGVTYYSLSDSSVAGQTDGYVKVDSISIDGYENAIITISGTSYYVKKGNYVRGYTGAGHGIDRWFETNTVTINSNSITITDSIFQRIDNPENFNGILLTFSALTSDGNLYSGSAVFDFSTDVSFYNANGVNLLFNKYWGGFQIIGALQLSAAKLELGSQQTLAHQDANGNWVLNEIPDYGEQLARCQRYFTKIPYSIGQTISTAISDGNGEVFFPIYFPTTMRATPVFTHTGILRVHGPGIEYRDVSASLVNTQGNIVILRVGGLNILTPYSLDSATGGVLNFSADM